MAKTLDLRQPLTTLRRKVLAGLKTKANLSRPIAGIRRMWRHQQGNALVVFGLAFPVLLMGAGVVVDYGILSEQRLSLQTVADASALAAAREFRLAGASSASVQSAAERFAKSTLKASNQSATITASA